jgi:hypothetical protein
MAGTEKLDVPLMPGWTPSNAPPMFHPADREFTNSSQ